MRIQCSCCGKSFKPRRGEKLWPHGSYCSRKCRERLEQRPERPLVPADHYNGGWEVHLRVGRKRDLRRLARVLRDVDRELIAILHAVWPRGSPGRRLTAVAGAAGEHHKGPAQAGLRGLRGAGSLG
jgi:hypothetical protein